MFGNIEKDYRYSGKTVMLNKDDCYVLRGLAITSIFLHNYCHQLPGAVHENEFWFTKENDAEFWLNVFSSDTIVQVFSFLGHLGVPVFVFLTGYGLSVKYGHSQEFVGVKSFLWSHYRKFFFPMLCGLLAYMIVYRMFKGILWPNWWQIFFSQMTMTSNLVLRPDIFIKPGPYWYFGLTMQFYIIYRLLLYRRDSSILMALVALSVIGLLVMEGHRYSLIWFKYNSVGWFLPFVLGVSAPEIKIVSYVKCWGWLLMLFVSLICVMVFGSYYVSWVFLPVAAIVLFVSVCKILAYGRIYWLAKYVGNLSLYIFVAHPIIREIVRSFINDDYRYEGLFIYVIIVVICARGMQKLTKCTIV